MKKKTVLKSVLKKVSKPGDMYKKISAKKKKGLM